MSAAAVAPVLVFAWGNRSRGDDALGPMCSERLRDAAADDPGVEFLEDYQLQVEHALDLQGRARVLFIDASRTAAAPFAVTPLQARRDSSFSSHAMSAQALLQAYVDTFGELPPPCTLLGIRAESFELGEPPSPQALQHLAAATRWAQAWLATCSEGPQPIP